MSAPSAMLRRRLIPSITLAVLGSWCLVGFVGAQVEPASTAFSGSASAAGVAVGTLLPGAPLTQAPVDISGPTAQAAAESFGQSRGYAAFPSPGDLVITGPSLIRGLLETGFGGLPPINTPELPAYPFFVESSNGAPPASVGEGPYRIEAESGPRSASARASGGVRADAAGSAALTRASASVQEVDGGIVATATNTTQGLTVGPLSLGEIVSTATAKLGDDGEVTRTSELRVSGVRIAGVSVALGPEGLLAAGSAVPLDLNSALADILAGAGITVEVLPAEESEERVTAPALVVRVPLDLTGVLTSGPGTVTMTIGGATASITGASPPPPTPEPVSSPPQGGSPAAPAEPSGSSFDTPALPTPLEPAEPTAGVGDGEPASVSAEPGELVGLFDVEGAYLLLAACAAYTAGLGRLVGILGVRRPWTSSVG